MTPDNWTPEQTASLREYKAQGWGDIRCAAALGKSKDNVRHKWDRMAREARQLPTVIAAGPIQATAEAYAARILACWRQSVEGIIQVGILLNEAKDRLEHGEFGILLADHLKINPRTAQRFMAIGSDTRITNTTHVSHLPASWGTLYELTRLDDAVFEAKLADKTISPEIERAQVKRLLQEQNNAVNRAAYESRCADGCTVDDLSRLIARGERFGAILCDPPWHFLTRSPLGEGRSATNHYDVKALDAIKALPVAQLAAPDSVLFLWMPDWHPRAALEVLESWCFVHKTTAFTWVKSNRSGEGWHMGQGYWTRANPESCWLATRGHPTRLDAAVRQLLIAPLGEHSEKPDEVNDRIERLVGGPYLELYARRERPGWVTWGDEIPRKNFSGSPPPTATNGPTSSTHSEARSLVAQSVGGGEP